MSTTPLRGAPWKTATGPQSQPKTRVEHEQIVITRKWYTVSEVSRMLGYGLTKTKMLIISGELRSLKDGRSRRVLPEWVDEYVARKAAA